MSKDDDVTPPKVLSHKGPLIRLLIMFDTGKSKSLLIEPLRYSAAGVILKPDNATVFLELGRELPSDNIHLVDDDGSVISSIENIGKTVTQMETMVLYPNGATWSGRIGEGHENKVPLIIWDFKLSLKYKNQKHYTSYDNCPWPEVPTIEYPIDGNGVGRPCQYIRHNDPVGGPIKFP